MIHNVKKFLLILATFNLVTFQSASADMTDLYMSGVLPSIVGNRTTVTGVVNDFTTARGIPGARVSSGSLSTITDETGAYTLLAQRKEISRLIINVSKTGYASASRVLNISPASSGELALNVDLLPAQIITEINPAEEFTAILNGSPGSVVIPAAALVLPDGRRPSGLVRAEITPIDPVLDIDLMPGDMTDENGEPIISLGALDIQFTDANGNRLDMAPGQTGTVSIPISAIGTAPAPATIPLWIYERERGVWVQEGEAVNRGTYYEGPIRRLGTWNADYLYDYVTINGCVQELNTSILVPYANVNLRGVTYNGSNSVIADRDGSFSIRASESAISDLSASLDIRTSNTVRVSTGTADITLPECIIMSSESSAVLTIRLTWGENPRDLDSHLIGPDGFHIWYSSKGSLSNEPFVNLDVDDTTSYGPEVITALRFPKAGTYHYSVYHFSGSSTISASPARVELNMNGTRNVFVPPSGQDGEPWWNVFDIIVDENGNTRMLVVNTWSNSNGETNNEESSDSLGSNSLHSRESKLKFVMPPKKQE